MIHEVDESLRLLMRQEALQGGDIDILFETPTKDWASRRNTPTIDVFLYDIREDIGRREEGIVDIRDAEGRVVDRRRPPRYYKLSYLVTAWTQRPEDEHRLLSACMSAFLKHGELPKELLVGSLEEMGLSVMVNIALPPPQDRSISDIWTALGGELKPSLELVVVAPLETSFPIFVGPLLTEPPVFGVRRAHGTVLDRNRPDDIPGVPAWSTRHPEPLEATTSKKGAKAPAGRRRGKAAPPDVEDAVADPLPDEALVMGEDGTGRVFRMQGMPRKRA